MHKMIPFLLIFLFATNVWACRCVNQIPISTFYAEADLVVLGKVVEIEGDFYGPSGGTAAIQVFGAWKMSVDRQPLLVHTDTSCAFHFEIEEEYLLFLHHDHTGIGKFETHMCLGNLRVIEAEKQLEWLKTNGVIYPLRD